MSTKHVGEMTAGKIKELLKKHDDKFVIVVTTTKENVTYGYSLHDVIEEGGLPSGIIEIRMKEMVMG